MDLKNFELDQLLLENVTLSDRGRDPILQNVDFQIPLDQTVVVESSHPTNALQFLKLLAGTQACTGGRVLWNGFDVFSEDLEINVHHVVGAYFEGQVYFKPGTVESFLKSFLSDSQFEDVNLHFDLMPYLKNDLSKMNYGFQKLIKLVQIVSQAPQLLVLEDPAQGLTESQWLNWLDYVQFQQRRTQFHEQHFHRCQIHEPSLPRCFRQILYELFLHQH